MAQQGQMGHRKCVSEDLSALLPHNQTVRGEGRKSRIEESKEARLVLSQEHSPSKYLGKLCWKEQQVSLTFIAVIYFLHCSHSLQQVAAQEITWVL